MKKSIFLTMIVLAVAVYLVLKTEPSNQSESLDDLSSETPLVNKPADSSAFVIPIERANQRVTKKPFGIKVSPNNSPVSPEKFSGYHTAVDFETFTDEADKDITIYAICDGPLLQKSTATGYGGFAVQRCSLNGGSVTIVYGHIKLSSLAATSGQELKKGEPIAILGKGYSAETSDERKHLHLGIHRGDAINIQGYVQSESELTSWIDPMTVIEGL